MIEYGKFFDFNSARERDVNLVVADNQLPQEVVEILMTIGKITYPLVFELLTNTTRFYERHFNQLISCIGREKRLIEFETPNRANMQFEYELDGMENLQDDIYYLFNTRDRLSWLKICMNNQQVPVAPSQIVKDLLAGVLENELTSLSKLFGISKPVLLDNLYDWSDGKPCFVYYIKNSQSVKVSYYDTIEENKNKGIQGHKCNFSPIGEHEVYYDYRPLSPTANSWLYVKAPNHFITHVECYNSQRMEASKSNDNVINSYVYRANGEECVYKHKLLIQVPQSMKFWYIITWVSALVLSILGIVALLHDFYMNCFFWCFSAQIWIAYLSKAMLSMVTILLATRGWLIHEEHLLDTISKWYTWLMVVLLFEVVIIGCLG